MSMLRGWNRCSFSGGRHNHEWVSTIRPSRTTVSPIAQMLPRSEFAVSTSKPTNDGPADVLAGPCGLTFPAVIVGMVAGSTTPGHDQWLSYGNVPLPNIGWTVT